VTVSRAELVLKPARDWMFERPLPNPASHSFTHVSWHLCSCSDTLCILLRIGRDSSDGALSGTALSQPEPLSLLRVGTITTDGSLLSMHCSPPPPTAAAAPPTPPHPLSTTSHPGKCFFFPPPLEGPVVCA
jgi:hypothetical protein